MAIKKERHLDPQDIESIIIDTTEQPCERPKRKQSQYYSGKKKRHTLKTEMRVTKEGRTYACIQNKTRLCSRFYPS